MSKTPRTDEHILHHGNGGNGNWYPSAFVLASFARQIETELAEARAEIERLNKNLRLLLCKTHFDKCEAGLFNSKNPDDEPCLICLMNAAERGEGL